MMRIFIDTNVLIDVLLKRENFMSAVRVLALSKDPKYTLYVSVLTMANLVYILRKVWKGDKLYNELSRLSSILHVYSITDSDYDKALALRAKDFEDSLQYFCAQSAQCDVIITRNEKDFDFSEITVLSPDLFLLKQDR